MGKLEGKVAVVTGASSGIGLATARLFAAEGATVVLTGRREQELSDAVRSIGELGGQALGLRTDVASVADSQKLHDFVKEKLGRVDVIFANAGGGALKPFGDTSVEEFDRTVDANFKGTFFSVQSLLPLMPDGGSIVLNASIAANKGMASFTVYSATKAAVRSFARTWTTDLAPRKIRVNTLSPGHIHTPVLVANGFSQADSDAYWAEAGKKVPLGRTGRPEEIASAALFLASDDSSYVTGIELTVDGGIAQV